MNFCSGRFLLLPEHGFTYGGKDKMREIINFLMLKKFNKKQDDEISFVNYILCAMIILLSAAIYWS